MSAHLSTRSIALVGMMEAGKSAIGRLLAQSLDLSFVDLDEEVERAAAMAIAEIFERRGEQGLRDLERQLLERMSTQPPHVIAARGGSFIDPGTRALIRERCLTVWLRADMASLVDRVSGSDCRPLLYGRVARIVLAELTCAREPIYRQADLEIENGSRNPAEVVEAIIALLPQAINARANRGPEARQ